MAITIRRAAAKDLPAMCKLADALVQEHVKFDAARYQPPDDVKAAYSALFAEHLQRPASFLAVAERSNDLVGYVFGVVEPPSLVQLTGHVGWIHDLYVSPIVRRCGAGGRLLDTAIAGLRSIGCPGGVLLGVAAQNVAAAALFRSRGFRPTLQEMTLGPLPAEAHDPTVPAR